MRGGSSLLSLLWFKQIVEMHYTEPEAMQTGNNQLLGGVTVFLLGGSWLAGGESGSSPRVRASKI
jgi:hypothetical protein